MRELNVVVVKKPNKATVVKTLLPATTKTAKQGKKAKTAESIKSHLKPYSIVAKRQSTIAHAFASALSPHDKYDKKRVEEALIDLGQDPNQITCIYCKDPAETWDHLVNLVRKKELKGYGHQIGNLVPCCTACNSKKGQSSFDTFIHKSKKLSNAEKVDLIAKLETHQGLAKEIKVEFSTAKANAAYIAYSKLQENILKLMKRADKKAESLRKELSKQLS